MCEEFVFRNFLHTWCWENIEKTLEPDRFAFLDDPLDEALVSWAGAGAGSAGASAGASSFFFFLIFFSLSA